MTEDDTFNKLRREDFYSVYSRWLRTQPGGNAMNESFLIGTGWDWQEYRDAFIVWLKEAAGNEE